MTGDDEADRAEQVLRAVFRDRATGRTAPAELVATVRVAHRRRRRAAVSAAAAAAETSARRCRRCRAATVAASPAGGVRPVACSVNTDRSSCSARSIS